MGEPGPASDPDRRAHQLQETWTSFLRQLREPVHATLRGGMSAGEIAYRLGELVHNYFRTRGVTLTSFELRRIVVALLDNYRQGWPELSSPVPELAAALGGAVPVAHGRGSLVAFIDRNGTRKAPPPSSGWNGESPPSIAPPVVTPDLPSSLVSVDRRPDTPGPAATGTETGEPRPSPPPGDPAREARVAPVVTPDLPSSLVSIDRRAQSAGPAAPDAGAAARQTGTAPPLPPTASVEAALAAIVPVLRRRCSSTLASGPAHDAWRWLRGAIPAALSAAGITLADGERGRLEQLAFDDLFGLGPLEALLRDESVSAAFVNGPHAVYVERRGRLEPASPSATFRDAEQLAALAGRLAERAGVAAPSSRNPLIDRQLADGTRVVIVAPPLAPAGLCIALHRPPARAATLDTLAATGLLSPQMAMLLQVAVRSRLNVLVCGGPGVGKSALLAALAGAIPAQERVVSIQRSAGLRLDLPNHVPLVAGDADAAADQAFAAALRLRPDRLLIDGLTEAVAGPLCRIAAAGVDGIAASMQAATPEDALVRLEAALRAGDPALSPAEVRRRLGHSVEVVVHLERDRAGIARVTHLADVAVTAEDVASRDLFSFEAAAGRFVATSVRPAFLPRVARAGLEDALLAAL